MVYFVQKKNRCKNGQCVAYKCAYCCFATSSSQNTQTLTAKTVQGSGGISTNKTKRGSGGNSYAGYLARRVGQIKCGCDTKCENK